MKFTQQEFAVLHFALLTTGQLSQAQQPIGRTFQADHLKMAIDVSEKLKKHVKDDEFQDGEVQFSTEEKAFVLPLLERPWSLTDGAVKLELEKKLS